MGAPSPAGGLGAGSLPSSKEKSEGPSLSPADFAAKAKEAYKESSEKSTTMFGRALSFLSESIHKLKEFPSAVKDWFDKFSITNMEESLNKAKESFKGVPIIGKFFELAVWVLEQWKGVKKNTINGVLETGFGAVLPAGAIAGLTAAIGGKIGLDELLKFRDAPGKLGDFLAQKVKDGVIEIPSGVWDTIRGPLGLPPLSEIGQRVSNAVEVGAGVLRYFDERIGLKGLRESLTTHLDREFPAWGTAMAWVNDLSDPQKIATALNIDLKNPSTWQAALEVGGRTFGVGASYLLLRRLMGSNSPWPGRISVNVAIYSFLSSNKVQDVVLQGIEQVRELETKVCGTLDTKIREILEQYSLKPEDIGLHLKNNQFGLADGMQWLTELAHENPEVALVALNGAYFTRHIIVYVVKTLFGFAAKGSWKTGKWALQHKAAAAALAGIAVVTAVKRREVVEDLANSLYGAEESENKKAFMATAADILHIDFNAPETLGEKVTDPVYERLLKDPVEFLSNGTLKMQLFKEMADGKIGWKWDGGVSSVLVGIMVQGNPVWHAINFEAGVFESLVEEFENVTDPGEDFNLWAVTILGAEGYVMGRGIWGAGKGYVALSEDISALAGGPRSRIARLFKTVIPFSKENRFLWFSALREMGDSVPFFKATEIIQANRVSAVYSYGRDMLVAINDKDSKKVSNCAKLIAGEVAKLDETKRYQILEDLDLNRALSDLSSVADDLKDKFIRNENTTNLIAHLERRLDNLGTRWSRLLSIGTYLKDGNFKSAVREIVSGPKIKGMDIDVLFKDQALTDLQSQKDALRKEIDGLKPGDLSRNEKLRKFYALESYLYPSKGVLVVPKFKGLKDAERAAKIEDMAYEIEAREKGVSARVTARIQEITADAKARGLKLDSPEIQKEIQRVDEELIQPFWKSKQAELDALNTQYRALPAKMRTPLLHAQVALAHENSYLTRVVKGAKGRAKVVCVLGALMFSTQLLTARDGSEQELYRILKDLGPEAGQLLLDVMPIAGTVSTFKTAITGKEWVTKRTVVGWERYSNYIWGTVGLAADTIAIIGFIPSGSSSLALDASGRLALAAARGSKTAARLVEVFPRIAKIAERMGGIPELAKSVTRFLKYTDKSSDFMKGLRMVEVGGMVAGTTVMVGGITANLIYGEDESDQGFEISPDLTPGAWAEASSKDPNQNVASVSSKEADIETSQMAQAA